MLFPAITLVCGLAQVALLYQESSWGWAGSAGALLVAILLLFSVTRLRWDAHLDMYLIMLGPGGLGMLVGARLAGPMCHQATWNAFALMTAGMLLPSIPLCWRYARCVRSARLQGRGMQTLAIDALGMQAGMLAGHLPAMLISSNDPRLIWFHHAIMLVGMLGGMLLAAGVQSFTAKGQTEAALPQ
jgi:hypothetical protein